MTKIIIMAVLTIMSLLTMDIVLLIGILAIVVFLFLISGLGKELSKQVIYLFFIGISLLILTVITMGEGTTIFSIIPKNIPYIGGSIPVTYEGISFGTSLALRFSIMILSFQMLLLTTQPKDIVHIMIEKLKIPQDYALMFLIAIRFVPTVYMEAKKINEAQISRGYHPSGLLIGKIKSAYPIITPLVLNSLARAEILGMAIETKGYGSAKRTSIQNFNMGPKDILLSAIFVSVLPVYIALLLNLF
jgi:energy-coupling factor transport system permease protein